MKLPSLFVALAALAFAPSTVHASPPNVQKTCAATVKHFEWVHCLDVRGIATDTVRVSEKHIGRPAPVPTPERESYEQEATVSDRMPVVLASASYTAGPAFSASTSSAPATTSGTPYSSPSSDTDAVNMIPDLLKDVSAGAGGRLLAVGLAVMLLTYAAGKYAVPHLGLNPAYLPIVAMGLGILTEFGLALANGKPLGAAALSGVSAGLAAGLAAVGKWEALTSRAPAKAAGS